MRNFLKLFLFTSVLSFGQTYIKGPALVEGVTSTATAASTTTLTNTSQTIQVFTGTTTQTLVLPSGTTLPVGRRFDIINQSTFAVTINTNGGSLLKYLPPLQDFSVVLTSNGSSAGTWAEQRMLQPVIPKNYLVNGEFRFWQRQNPTTLTTTTDASYSADMWKLFTEQANGQAARVAETFNESPTENVANIRQSNASAGRIGYGQIVVSTSALRLRGKQVTFSVYARTDSSQITSLRMCIGEWTGTADSVTNDIVSSWGSTPTFVANFVCDNTPSTITISSTMSKISVTGVVSTSANNLVPFIWTPNQEATNDNFYITQAQLVVGSSPMPWESIALDYGTDLLQCQNFYEKSYKVDTDPGTVTQIGYANYRPSTSTNPAFPLTFNVSKWSVPTITMYSPATGASGKCNDNGSDLTCAGTNASQSRFSWTSGNVGAANQQYTAQWTADASP